AGGDRGFELLLRPAGGFSFGRVKNGEVLADDLVGLVPLDAHGADIPARNVAAGIKHENGVIARAFHHQAKAFLAQLQSTFGPRAVGDVAENQNDAINPVVATLDGRGAVVDGPLGAVPGD